jgi:hypothetical protein
MSESRQASAGDAPLVGAVGAPHLHAMSWNIRRTMAGARRGGADFWPGRVPLGVQEAMVEQADALSAILGPDFRRFGRGRRPGGNGEGCPVFYDSRRFELLSWTQSALSPTPNVPGSRGWGNLVPRIVVAGEFRCRVSGTRFTVLNTHLDHLSGRSRLRSAEMVATLALASGRPALVMGDFNDTPGSPPHVRLQRAGLRDSWSVAAERRGDGVGTYSGYGPPASGGRRIDWMLVTPEFDVAVAAINTARFEGRAASDHEPIHAIIRLP